MSFGFSVGDILLVGQLAYKLYSTVTTGRRSAAKDLKELEDVLFSLHCALDHLGKAAKDISVTASKSQGANAIELQYKLDTMIDSCGATLEELDSVTKRYREAVELAEGDVVEGYTSVPPSVEALTHSNKKRLMAGFKRSVRVNWMKIRWDIERSSLSEYRDKLQSHTDAINIVLNTFLWSATHRIEADGKVNAERMLELQNQVLQSNTSLLQLVQEIHTILLTSKRAPSPPRPPAPKLSPHHSGIAQIHRLGLAMDVGGGRAIHSINPHFSPIALMTISQPPDSTGDVLTPFGPMAMRQEPPSDQCVVTPKPAREIPDAIAELNIRRQSTGSKEFKEYREKYYPPKPPPKPSFLTLETPTIRQLRDGLSYIFHPFPQSTAGQAALNRDKRKKEAIHWTQGLDHLLDSWISEPTSSSPDPREVNQAKQNDMVDLLVHLNWSIEKSDDKLKMQFYQGTEQAGIDGVLDKLQTVSKSVRVMKEVEEFEDVREEWMGNQRGG